MFHEGLTGSSEEPEGNIMSTKAELIKKVQDAGDPRKTSTLNRIKTADLELMLDSLQAGKTGDSTDRDTDCGGCENGECDACGFYECCDDDSAYGRSPVEDEDAEPTADLPFTPMDAKFTGKNAADLLRHLGAQITKDWEDKKVYKRVSFELDGGKWSAYAYGDKKLKMNPVGKADEKKARLQALETVLVETGVQVSWTTGTDRPHAMVTFE